MKVVVGLATHDSVGRVGLSGQGHCGLHTGIIPILISG